MCKCLGNVRKQKPLTGVWAQIKANSCNRNQVPSCADWLQKLAFDGLVLLCAYTSGDGGCDMKSRAREICGMGSMKCAKCIGPPRIPVAGNYTATSAGYGVTVGTTKGFALAWTRGALLSRREGIVC